MTDLDPVLSNPEHYRLLWENEHVRVLEYTDLPGDETTEHHHPNSVMVTLSDFRRQLKQGERTADVELAAGQALWLPEREHSGRNTGDSPTHTILIELKNSAADDGGAGALGPSDS